MAQPVELLQGTLDLLILKAVSLGPLHGYGVLVRIQQLSREAFEIPQGSLYPALYQKNFHSLVFAGCSIMPILGCHNGNPGCYVSTAGTPERRPTWASIKSRGLAWASRDDSSCTAVQ